MELSPRQQEIISTSMALVSEEGINGFTMRRVADKLNISEPAIYRHFKNKEAILVKALEIFRDQTAKRLKEFESEKMNSCDLLLCIFQNRLLDFINNPPLAALIFREDILDGFEDARDLVLEMMRTNQKMVETIMVQGQSTGQFRPEIAATELAFIFMASIRSLVQQWHIKNHSFDLAIRGNAIMKSLLMLYSA